jgi:hypothetical protein
LEELLPKDNENVFAPLVELVGPSSSSEPIGFAPSDMLRCEECLRANPPTRAACFYCGAALPVTESAAPLRKPTLLSPDKLEPAYNIIFAGEGQSAHNLQSAADFLKLKTDELQKFFSLQQRLPLARTATIEEAQLTQARLSEFGIQTLTLSDDQLGVGEKNIVRVRSVVFNESGLRVKPAGGDPVELNYADLLLLVQARITTKTTAVRERKSRTTENELLATSELFADEFVIDLYSSSHEVTWRIFANSFDFSCLGEDKALVVNQNMLKLPQVIESKASRINVDNSYNSVRHLLDLIWGFEQETKSDGWRREGPGRLTIGVTTKHSNENQFTRYSRLRFYLSRNNH